MAKRFLRFPHPPAPHSHSYGKYQVHHHGRHRHQGAKGQDSLEWSGQGRGQNCINLARASKSSSFKTRQIHQKTSRIKKVKEDLERKKPGIIELLFRLYIKNIN